VICRSPIAPPVDRCPNIGLRAAVRSGTVQTAGSLQFAAAVAADDPIARARELRERILSVERRALLLTESAGLEELRSEAQSVAALLQLLEIALRGNPPEEVVSSVDHMFAAAAARIGRLG